MIELTKAKLFKLIQEMKEYRKALPKMSTNDMMKRHKTRVEYILLDRILTDEGIDKLISKFKHEKRNLEMVKKIVEEESENN